jgi:hypothetical protein
MADLSDFLLFHVCRDPHSAQGADFEVPLWEKVSPTTPRSKWRYGHRSPLHLARQNSAHPSLRRLRTSLQEASRILRLWSRQRVKAQFSFDAIGAFQRVRLRDAGSSLPVIFYHRR